MTQQEINHELVRLRFISRNLSEDCEFIASTPAGSNIVGAVEAIYQQANDLRLRSGTFLAELKRSNN